MMVITDKLSEIIIFTIAITKNLLRFCRMPESKSMLLPGEKSENSEPDEDDDYDYDTMMLI